MIGTKLVETLSWALVEADSTRPNMVEIKRALEMALSDAATLDLSHEARKKNLVRMAQVVGIV